jgi:hypothetical protein
MKTVPSNSKSNKRNLEEKKLFLLASCQTLTKKFGFGSVSQWHGSGSVTKCHESTTLSSINFFIAAEIKIQELVEEFFLFGRSRIRFILKRMYESITMVQINARLLELCLNLLWSLFSFRCCPAFFTFHARMRDFLSS